MFGEKLWARLWLALFAALLSVGLAAAPARAQGTASITYVSQTNATFTSGVVAGTITVDQFNNATAASGIANSKYPVSTNFPAAWYTPALVNTNFQTMEIGNQLATQTGSARVTITFDRAVTNPVLHFVNLDNATYQFSATSRADGSSVSLTRVSGNNEFELTGTLLNSTANVAINAGCESNAGANGNGGCGSLRLNGTYRSIQYTMTEINLGTTSGDSHGLAITLPAGFIYDYGDAPASYGAARHDWAAASANPRLGAITDYEAANQASAGATLDDTTSSDDEDALSAATPVTLAAGGTHTQTSISCFGTATIYGWIDFNRNGVFTDTGERSSVTACSSGTATLSWTMPAIGGLSAGASFLRIRTATSAAEITSPTANATSGEAEDYSVTLAFPSANLGITKSDGTASTVSGSQTTYTITVTNGGPDAAIGAVLRDAAVTGMSKITISCGGTPGQCTGATTPTIAQLEAGYALPTLAFNETYQLSLTVVITATGGSVTNTATIAAPTGTTDPATGNNSASDVNSVTTRIAGTPPILSCPVGSTIHDWDTVTWNAGDTNNSYSVAALGSTNFALTNQGVWGNLAVLGGQNPALTTAVTGGFAAQNTLAMYVDLANQTQVASLTMTLPSAVPALQFRLYDVDWGDAQFADRVTVTGSFGGNAVTPVLTAGTAHYVIGNTAYGDQLSDPASSAGNLTISFTSPVDTVVITYGNHALAPADPGFQAITLADISFCRPHVALSLTKVSATYDDGSTTQFFTPGSDALYTLGVSNAASGSVTQDSVFLMDALPSQLTFFNGDANGPAQAGTDVVIFNNAGSGLTFNPATDLRYATTAPASFAACTYTPTAGYDANVKYICLNPKGTLSGKTGATDPGFSMTFRARIN